MHCIHMDRWTARSTEHITKYTHFTFVNDYNKIAGIAACQKDPHRDRLRTNTITHSNTTNTVMPNNSRALPCVNHTSYPMSTKDPIRQPTLDLRKTNRWTDSSTKPCLCLFRPVCQFGHLLVQNTFKIQYQWKLTQPYKLGRSITQFGRSLTKQIKDRKITIFNRKNQTTHESP